MPEFQQIDNKLLDSDSSSNDHNDVVIALTPIHHDWFKLGGFLKISKGTLQGISKMYNNDHFRQMSHLIGTWISRPTREHHPSWRVLCQALADMGERNLAYKIAGIEENDQSTSKSANSAATVDIAVRSRIAPTVGDLQVQLHNLTAWELVATHLPGIDQHDVARITRDFRGAEQQKLELYAVWLDKCTYASWDHVINALEINNHNRLVANINQWLKTKPGRKVVSTDNGHVPPQPSNRQANGLEGPTDNGHLPEPDVLEDTDGDPSPDDDDDTPDCPITLNDDVDRNVIPKGTVSWDSKGDSAKAGRNRQCHLVVIITNEYRFTNGRLIGIEEDRQQLYKTFGGEEIFRLVKLKDTRKEEMEEELSNIMDHFQQPVEKQYKSVFIIFSGHGGMLKGQKKSYILSEDCQRLSLDDLIHSFEEKIGNAVPKFFLIDACRSVSAKDLSKGLGRAKVNSLYAYATQKGERAWMNEETGSYWIQEVARLLRQERNIPVSKIIKKANKNVSEKTTQNPQMNDQFLKDNGKELCLKIIDYEQEKDSIAPGGIRARHGKDGTDTTPAVDHAKSTDSGTTSEETLAPPTDKPTSKKLPSVSDSFGTIKNIIIGVLLTIIISFAIRSWFL